jgi:DNA-binding transcriptional LysR family regulator
MELNYLRIFYEVAKIGKFTEAARRLNISQSALSRSVALLEEQEGVQLMLRSKRGVELTPVGSEVFRHCEQLFQTVHKIQEICKGLSETIEGPLHFAAADHVANYLLVPPLQAFRREFPGVIAQIQTGIPEDIVTLVQEGKCEFALMFAKVITPQIVFEALREEPMALVVRADVWREAKGANQSAKLNGLLETMGYISSIGAHKSSRPSRVLQELFGKMPLIGCEVNSQEVQKKVCLAGGGIAYLSRFMVENEIRSGELHEISVDDVHVFKLWLATRKGEVLSAPARIFIDRLRAAWK